MYKREYEWAMAHPETEAGRHLLDLAQLYAVHADLPTLGLVRAAAENVRKEMMHD
jgi:hypothetical protein